MFGIGFRHRHYAELLTNPSAYQTQVDFLEVHSENFFGTGGAAIATLTQARAHWPISLHGVGLALGSATGIDPWHLDQLASLVERLDPHIVSDHACYARGSLQRGDTTSEQAIVDVHASDLLPIPFSKTQLDVLCANVSAVQDRLKRTIAVENLSAYFAWKDVEYSETEFLNTLASRTGCRLLVDVNNIYVNALNANKWQLDSRAPLDICQEWLSQINPSHLRELHVAGHCVMDDIVIDDHSSKVCDDVWTLYMDAVSRFKPNNPNLLALVEWDTDVPELEVLLGEVQKARVLNESRETSQP